MSDTIFQLRDVHFSYEGTYPALCGVTFGLRKGEKTAVIGANGSGKSTLLQMLDGLIFPGRGRCEAFGSALSEEAFADPSFSRSFRRRVGLVFQNPDTQLFCPTVKEDILFGPLQLGLSRKETDRHFDRLVEVLGISSLLSRPPHRLSIGEKRKVAIASTLVIDPEVLLLDEPTAGLDPTTTRHILDLIMQENASGKTIVTSTHDLHIVAEIADLVHVFSAERTIVKSGTPDAILSDTGLLKAHNLAHIHSHRHKDTIHVHPHVHTEHHSEHGSHEHRDGGAS